MRVDSRIYVAGHRGLVGSAIVRTLERNGYRDLVVRTSAELDLRRQLDVEAFFSAMRPHYVFDAAARVGGIYANSHYPAEFIRDNLQVQTNLIDAAHRTGVTKFCFLGSSCIYPRMAPQPMREEHLLSGSLEPTNEWYAIAKIAGIKMCQAYRQQYGFNAISLMPTNLYGPGDNFSAENSHVLPALLRRFHEARVSAAPQVVIWGTGKPRREFLHVDDLAAAAVQMMQNYDDPQIINIGTGTDIAIADLAKQIADTVGYRGDLKFDESKPDGTPRKLLDVSRAAGLGWRAKIDLASGLQSTYEWFLANTSAIRS
jgi:GDP-L-fucose synthase